MPFDEDEVQQSAHGQKIGLKNVSSQKSIFESAPKKPSPEAFREQVSQVQQKASSQRAKLSQLGTDFRKFVADKTLSNNKSVFQKDFEMEHLRELVVFAQGANTDPNEPESAGSLALVGLLLQTTFAQRDRINLLEYQLSELNKKIAALDAQKKSE